MILRHTQLSSAEAQAQQVGSTRIAPGIWRDAAGDVHFSVPELLELVDLEDTPENRAAVCELVVDLIRRRGPQLEIILQEAKP